MDISQYGWMIKFEQLYIVLKYSAAFLYLWCIGVSSYLALIRCNPVAASVSR